MRCQVFLFLLGSSLLFSDGSWLLAADETENYPDKAGREAMRLWDKRENNREIAEAARRYWDYWASRQPQAFSPADLWFNLEQTQKWLKDPDKNEPPPPPPIPPPYLFYPYPYPFFYQPYYSPYFYQVPPALPTSPYYPHPDLPEKVEE
jgi:hypothetical protein